MRALTIFFTIIISSSSLATYCDDGDVTWAKQYPKPGPKPGQILVKGHAKAATGYKLVSARAEVWPSGGEVKTVKVVLDKEGALAATTIAGLDSATQYNVLLIAVEANAAGERERASEPVVVVAP